LRSFSHKNLFTYCQKDIPLTLVLEDDSEINENLKKIIEDPILMELANERVFEVLNLSG
jgi:GR25 family glycosyltransferase involved in LPS biosynthesis